MKKTLLLFAIVLFSVGLFAQNSLPVERTITKNMVKVLDDIEDFTITDSDGNTWNLYEQLGLGKTVFLDLFFDG
ncbi:hypothetical protein N9934_00055 [Desulfosarcina sp.]|nr:hypothetical protein [Desulfosarcina sp.]